MRLFSEFFWSFYPFFILAKDIKKGDLIFCSMPTITSTFTAAAISHLFNVRLIIDLRDQWPEIFKDTNLKFIDENQNLKTLIKVFYT